MTRFFRWSVLAIASSVVFAPSVGFAQLNATPVGTGFSLPVFASSAPGNPGLLYVVQKGGVIRTLNPQSGAQTTFMSMSDVTGSGFTAADNEQGLLGMAFHPNFQSNGLFYIKYTVNTASPGDTIRVEQYQVDGAGQPVLTSRRTVIQWDHGPGMNHNAGWIGFNPVNGATGPNSGHLYIPTGDGGAGNDPNNHAQDKGSIMGKLLRINVGNGLSDANPNYTIPSGNMTGAGVLPELFYYGLRNPYRASFDRGTGNLYIGDVGQADREEVDFVPNGGGVNRNFGWRLREGTIQNPAVGVGGPPPADNVEPIHDYIRSLGTTVTGGYVYRGSHLDDTGDPLDGEYFFADFGSGRIWSLRYTGSFIPTATDRTAEFGFSPNVLNPSSFAEDGFGNLYLINYGGTIYQLVPVPEPTGIGLVALGVLAVGAIGRRLQRRLPPAPGTHTVPS